MTCILFDTMGPCIRSFRAQRMVRCPNFEKSKTSLRTNTDIYVQGTVREWRFDRLTILGVDGLGVIEEETARQIRPSLPGSSRSFSSRSNRLTLLKDAAKGGSNISLNASKRQSARPKRTWRWLSWMSTCVS